MSAEASPSLDELIAASGLERIEARLLLTHCSGRSKSWLIAHGDEPADAALAGNAARWFSRRRAGEPMAYLLGEKEFFSYRFQIGPGVLIPRPETELLVQWGLDVLQATPGTALKALDLGCGSGCIGLSLALEARRLGLPLGALTQSDIASEALSYTSRNAAALGVSLWPAFDYRLLQGSWFEALPAAQHFDLILSNPPYIRADDEHLLQGDLRHEPRHALASGESGLVAIDEIAARAGAFLRPGGYLLMEHGFDQADQVRSLLGACGFSQIETRRDLAGVPRLTGGLKD